MIKISKKNVMKIVTKFYLESNDFNGISILILLENFNEDRTKLKAILKELVEEELVGVIDEDTDINPHVNRRGFEQKEKQLPKLDKDLSYHICIYPTPKYLKAVVNPRDYESQPYKLCLAFGEPQLSYRSFDLSVLEFYRNDPRYRYENDDMQGHIYYNSEEMTESDKVLLQTFGFSYDNDFNRAVAVFLRYLVDLTLEHQQIWKAKELQGDYKLHPDYYRTTIIGDWPEREPICTAFVEEIYIINQMVASMGRPPLFRDDFGEYGKNRPKHFGFLIRPTLKEFNDFMLLLDKMLSDNINKKFFQNEVPYENETKRKDGKIKVTQKGTLQILDDWIRKFFRTNDWKPWEETITTLRKIRKMRQKPAHSVNEDVFDQKYFKEQREIIKSAYSAVRTLRLMFANHPKVRDAAIEIPDWLKNGKIWTI